jgi:O-antigen/teichoic acid export membrane protein
MVPVAFAGAWFLQAPISLVRHLGADSRWLGCFSVDMQVLQLFAGLWAAAAHASLPPLSRAAAQGGRLDPRFARRAIPVAVVGAAVCAAVAQIAGPWLLPLVVGTGYRDAGAWLGTTLTLLIPYGVALLYSEALLAVELERVAAVAAVSGSVLLVLLAWWWHGRAGGAGVLFACGIAAGIWSLLTVARAEPRVLERGWAVGAVLVSLALFVGMFLAFAAQAGRTTGAV